MESTNFLYSKWRDQAGTSVFDVPAPYAAVDGPISCHLHAARHAVIAKIQGSTILL